MAEDPRPHRPISGIGRRRAAALAESGADYARRRQEIIEAAAQTFKVRGYAQTSLGDVARALGTDRATLYYYYSNKSELFQEVVRGAAESNLKAAERIARSSRSPQAKLQLLIEALLVSYGDKHFPYLYVYIQEDMSKVTDRGDSEWADAMASINGRYQRCVTDIIQEGIDSGSFRPIASASIMANGVLGVVNWTHRWFKPTGTMSAIEVGKVYADMVLRGLLADR